MRIDHNALTLWLLSTLCIHLHFTLSLRAEVAPFFDGKMWSYVSFETAAALPFGEFEHASAFSDDVAYVRRNGKYSLLHSSKGLIYPFQFDDIKSLGAISVFSKNGRCGAASISGQIVIPAIYDTIFRFDGQYSVGTIGDDCYIVSKTGRRIKTNMIVLSPFSQGRCVVGTGEGVKGYMDVSGAVVIEPTFKFATNFQDGYASAADINGRWACISWVGEWVFPPTFELLTQPVNGFALAKAGSKWGVIKVTGDFVHEPIYDVLTSISKDGILAGRINASWFILHCLKPDAKQITANKVESFAEGLAPAEMRQKWGYINSLGEWSLWPSFDMVSPVRSGIGLVKAGKLIIPFSGSRRQLFHSQVLPTKLLPYAIPKLRLYDLGWIPAL